MSSVTGENIIQLPMPSMPQFTPRQIANQQFINTRRRGAGLPPLTADNFKNSQAIGEALLDLIVAQQRLFASYVEVHGTSAAEELDDALGAGLDKATAAMDRHEDARRRAERQTRQLR